MNRQLVLLTASLLGLALTGCATGPRSSRPAGEPAAAPNPPASEAAAPTEEEPPVNTLRWTTASEVENFGFDIYRSENEDGPFVRITPDPLPGGGTIDEPQHYTYVDSDIDPTKGYYYYIESISMAGVRERFSPVVYVEPKRPLKSDE